MTIEQLDWPPGSGEFPKGFEEGKHSGAELDVMYIEENFGPLETRDIISIRVAAGLVMLAHDLLGLVLDGSVDMEIAPEQHRIFVNGVQQVPLAHILDVSLTDPENADISVFFDLMEEEEEDAEVGEG